jgi:hypothetical protein
MPQTDQPQSDSPTLEPTVEPIPPRNWWLKRIGVGVGLLVIALVALRLWWGWEANRRLQAEIDKIIAAREPIYPEDFDSNEGIPDDQNAARFLTAAEQAIRLTPEQLRLIDEFHGDGRFTDEHQDQARAVVESNTVAMGLIRQARDARRIDWSMPVRSPVFSFMPATSGQRQLSKLLSLSIRYHHFVGDDKAAVELMRDALALAKAVEQMPSLIPTFVSMAADGVVFQNLEAISATLNIQTDNGSVPLRGRPCTRADTDALLRDLLDEEARREAIRHAMFFERMSELDLVRGMKNGAAGMSWAWGAAPPPSPTPWGTAGPYLITPLVELDGATMIRDSNLRLQAATEPDWGRAKRVLPKEPAQNDALGSMVHFVSGICVPSLERLFLLHFRSLTSRHLAGTALAIRLYQVDQGRRPQTLGDLVPNYLPEIPLDPFAEDGSAIGYAPEGRPAILYSVGPDGVDDGGRYAFRSGGIDWDNLDIPFFLDGNRPTKPEDVVPRGQSSIQAGEDEKNAEDEQGSAKKEGEGEEKP